MLYLDKLTVKNWHLFNKETSFEFKDGISLVKGRNYSGKSLLFSAFPTLLSLIYEKNEWEKPPKGSELSLEFSNGKIPVVLNCDTTNSSTFSLSVGNKEMQPHKRADAERILLQNWKMPKALFQSTVYLRGKDHPLSIGTSGTRSEWLADVLDISTTYDAYQKHEENVLKEMSSAMSKKVALEDERDKIQEMMPSSTVSEVDGKKASNLLAKYSRKLSELPLRKGKLEQLISVIEKLEKIPDIRSSKKLEEKLKEAQRKLHRLQDLKEDQIEIEKLVKENKKAQSILDEITSRYPDIAPSIALDSTQTLFDEKSKEFEDQQGEIKRYRKDVDSYGEQADLRNKLKSLKNYEPVYKSLEEAKNKLAVLRSRKQDYQERLSLLEETGTDRKTCPSCGNKLSKDHLEKEKKKLQDQLDSLPRTLKGLSQEIQYWELKDNVLVKKPVLPSFTRKQHVELKDYVNAIGEAIDLIANMHDIPKLPKNIDKEEKRASRVVEKLSRRIKAGNAADSLISLLPEEYQDYTRDQLHYLLIEKLKPEIKQIDQELIDGRNIVEKYQKVKSRYDTENALIKQHRSTLNRLTEEIDSLKEQTKYFEHHKMLHQAFGSNGVRLYHMNETAKNLSRELTEMSTLFFDKTYTFDIEIAPRKLNVRVERNGRMGSLSTLSGAENSSWPLLCAMALMRILPAHQRCDTIIMDEIEAKMDAISRTKIIGEVIPELQKMVPKIVFISPQMHGEFNVNADHSYQVIKENKHNEYFSKLVEM